MEIDITKFMNMSDEDLMYFSASQAELGSDAGAVTWDNAMSEAEREPLVHSKEDLESARAYIEEFGVWDEDEISDWSDQEVNALLVQLIAGDIRGREKIFQDSDGKWLYYIWC